LLDVAITVAPSLAVTEKYSVPTPIPLLGVEKMTSVPLLTRYPGGIPELLLVVSVYVPGEGLDIVYENGS
jgi:hypothetical protein